MRRVGPLALPVGVMAAARLTSLAVMVLAGRADGIPVNTVAASWDGTHYIYNAAFGFPEGVFIDGEYKGAALAFYPLYSLLLRAARPLGVSYVAVGLVLSFAVSLVVAALLWLLVRDWAGRTTADATVVLFAFFPGATVLSLLYAEGVMLALVLGSLLAMTRRRWVVAGVLGALATSARPNAIVLAGCAAWAAVVAIRERGDWRALTAPLLTPLGAVAYHLYLWRHTGKGWSWFEAQRDGWDERFSLFSIVDFVRDLGEKPHEFQEASILVCTAFAAVAFVLLVKARPPAPWMIWTVGVLFLVVTSNNLGVRPRFALTAFPLFVPLAQRLRGVVLAGTVGVFAAVGAVYAALAVASVTLIP